MKFAALIFILLVSLPSLSHAKAKRRVIRMPAAIITCGEQCKVNLRLQRVMELVVEGRLAICGYEDEKAIWVRKIGDGGGECTKVPFPLDRLTGWRHGR